MYVSGDEGLARPSSAAPSDFRALTQPTGSAKLVPQRVLQVSNSDYARPGTGFLAKLKRHIPNIFISYLPKIE